MRDIVFATTRHYYDSYVDYLELIKVSRFETFFIDEIDLERDAVYICSPINAEFRPIIEGQKDKDRKATLIEWCLERPQTNLDAFYTGKKDFMRAYTVEAVWHPDRHVANGKHVQFVPVGGHPDYGEIATGKAYDFIHLSYVWGRRDTLWSQLKGFKVAENAWGKQRHTRLMNSKYLVNVHQDSDPIIEPLRFILAASYGLPIISEECADPYPYVAGEDFISAPYDMLVEEVIRTVTGIYKKHKDRALALREKMTTEYSFRRLVEEAVDDMEGSHEA